MSFQDSLQQLVGSAYRIERELGGGGMSRVFVAHERALKRDVVIKVLPPELISSTSAARFAREIEVTARLQHPHILPLITAGGNERMLYYVAPYIRGESLKHRLASGERPSLAEGLRLIGEIVSAVALAHRHGVVHRDIKPANVLLSDGHAILADFGIARALEGADEGPIGSGTGSLLGARAYLAPERPRDERADLYALAVLAHEILAGAVPADGARPESISAALRAAHAELDARRAQAIAQVLARGFATDAGNRFASATEFGAALSRAGAERAGRLTSTRLVAASVAALAVVGAGAFYLRARPPARPAYFAVTAAPAEHGERTGQPLVIPSGTPNAAADSSPEPATPAPAISPARLLLDSALNSAWRNAPSEVEISRAAASRALADSADLDAHDRAIARGLVALGSEQFTEACDAFERARRARADFDAWYGLAECHARDERIVTDSATKQVRFRTSYADAADAVIEAVRAGNGNAPGFSYARAAQLLFIDPTRVRRGLTEDGRQLFGETVAMDDSVVFNMIPVGTRRITAEGVAARARAAEIARNRLYPLLVNRLRMQPADPTVHELLAQVLEYAGNITEPNGDRLTAVDEIRKARALADAHTRPRLVTMEMRLLLRRQLFADVARFADSVLTATPTPRIDEAEPQLILALLTGRVARATSLLEQVSGLPGRQVRTGGTQPIQLSATLVRERAEFVVRAVLGVCDDRTRVLPARLAAMFESAYAPGNLPPGAELVFLERPLMLALPCLGPKALSVLHAPSQGALRIVRVYDPAGRADALRELDGAERARAAAGAQRTPDNAMIEANMRLVAGDSSGAYAALRLGVEMLPVAPTGMFNNENLAGPLSRAIALMYDLAAARGDQAAARKWGSAIAALWKHADPELQPIVERARALGDVQRAK